jgi:hypothetical protein
MAMIIIAKGFWPRNLMATNSDMITKPGPGRPRGLTTVPAHDENTAALDVVVEG